MNMHKQAKVLEIITLPHQFHQIHILCCKLFILNTSSPHTMALSGRRVAQRSLALAVFAAGLAFAAPRRAALATAAAAAAGRAQGAQAEAELGGGGGDVNHRQFLQFLLWRVFTSSLFPPSISTMGRATLRTRLFSPSRFPTDPFLRVGDVRDVRRNFDSSGLEACDPLGTWPGRCRTCPI